MIESEHPHLIVLHVAGTDRPGVTARIAEVIAEENAHLVTIGQSVLHGYLMLSAIVNIPRESFALRRLLLEVTKLGLRLEVSAYKAPRGGLHTPAPLGLCVTLLGPLADGRATAAITRLMADRALNIREIRALSSGELTGLEMIADLPDRPDVDITDLRSLRGELLHKGSQLGVDLAVQRDDIFRRSKRLVCMDVDSTFVKGEFIDELAELVGVRDEVAEITARAMKGELDFEQALTARVKLLDGLPIAKALDLCESFELTPGADDFVRTLKRLGFVVGLVSGGFNIFVGRLKDRFGLDFAVANELESKEGKFTGRILGSIVDSARKAQVLKEMAEAYKCRLEQTVAIGDGANDMLMLQTAGLGIAFRAKPKLQEVADMSLNHNERLDTLLYLMGFSAHDLANVGQ